MAINRDFFADCRPAGKGRISESFLEMYRGDTLDLTFTITKENGLPVDITGGFFWFTLKTDLNHSMAQAVIAKTTGDGLTVISGPKGQVRLILDPEDTLNIPVVETVTYYWDLQYQDPNTGAITTVYRDKIRINLEVTTGSTFRIGLVVPMLSDGAMAVAPIVGGVRPVQDGDGLTLNEKQDVIVDGAVTGSFTLTVEDPSNPGNFETTSAIAWNALDTDIKSALETDISFIDTVTVSGASSLDTGIVQVEFTGASVTLLNFSLMTMDVSSLG